LPAIAVDPAPGETIELPPLKCYRGPVGVVMRREGGVRGENLEQALTLTLLSPSPDHRESIWQSTLGDGFMAQQLVGDDRGEYTVGAFGLGDGTVTGTIVLRRTLARDGSTAKAWTSPIPELDAAVNGLAKLFRPIGPTNFQFRRHGGAYLLLEINPRLSSSTSLRAAFGANDAAMCVEYFLEGRTPGPRPVRSGFAVRYIEDVVTYDRDRF